MSAKRRQYRKKVVETEESEGQGSEGDVKGTIVGDQGEDDVGATIEELMEIRKLRRKAQGVDVEQLARGDELALKKKKKKQEEEEAAKADPFSRIKVGGLVKMDGHQDDDEGPQKGLKLDTFTTQTNRIDVDKHMMAYIEEEMRKRRGDSGTPVSEDDRNPHHGERRPHDIYEELYHLPEHLKLQSKPLKEGGVQWSSQMLTAIPEVDLGIEARLANIEQTEKAKRKLLETGDQKPKNMNEFAGQNYVASNRYHTYKIQSEEDFQLLQEYDDDDDYALSEGETESAGVQGGGTLSDGSALVSKGKKNIATDEIVLERFKKRMKP